MTTWFHLSREARLTAHWIALAFAWMGGQLWWGLAQTLITSLKEFFATTARAVLDRLTAASTFSLMKPGEGGFQLWCEDGWGAWVVEWITVRNSVILLWIREHVARMSTFSPWNTAEFLKFHIPSTTNVIAEDTHQINFDSFCGFDFP